MNAITRRAVLAGISVVATPPLALAAGSAVNPPEHMPVHSAAPEDDAALLALGERFEGHFATEEAARIVGRETGDWDAWDAAYAETSAVVREIEAVRATTLRGLQIKARCIQWCYGDDPISSMDEHTTDIRLAHQIVRHLLALPYPPVS